jgi:type IV pilus assembly protein PilY1
MKTFACALLLAGLLGHAVAQPSDIDIYAGVNPNLDRPNVLLLLDASANWNPSVGTACSFEDNGVANGAPTDPGSKYAVELCALHNVVDRLPVGPGGEALFNVGVMLSNANPASNKGGYPLRAFTPLTVAGKASLKTAIRGVANTPAWKANQPTFALMMHEAYLYFKGLPPRVGHLNTPFDAMAFSGGRYNSPSADSCGRNYVIFIANGAPNSGEDSDARPLLQGLGGLPAVVQITNPALGNLEKNWADEYARFMRGADVSGKEDVQGIITHGVAVVDPSKANQKPEREFRNFVRSMASYGGGNYYEANEANVLVEQLLKIFNQIQAVNSVFASASLPVSVNARGTYLNQVFMGMFRPDADGRPRWRGNLKQYQFALDAGENLYLADAEGQPAINAGTGFVAPAARSFWTAPSSYWTATPMGTPPSTSDAPDGEVVEKGAVAQRLRAAHAGTQEGRRVYTCLGCSSAAVTLGGTGTLFHPLNTAITAGALGVAPAARSDLINWVRGSNNAGDEPGPLNDPATTVRPSIHGDVLHSRPAVLNYGDGRGVVVFYGANDGQLRAVSGAQGAGGGDELWSFIPEEHFGKLARLRGNDPLIRLSTTTDPSALPRDYFVDGPIGTYQRYAGGVMQEAIIFVGMRRGGRQIYALDVSQPEAPRFLWKVTPTSPGMAELGQTWSEPRVARIKGRSEPVLIMGGGYDAAAEDSGGVATMGRGVYVLDARTGTLLRRFSALVGDSGPSTINRSVAADVTLQDTDADGLVDRAYAVDLGGQVYRIDFEGPGGEVLEPAQWSAYRLGNLSGGTATGRKFFFAPDIVQTPLFTALLFGSGDREKPLLSATQDHFFQIFDRRPGKGAPAGIVEPIVFADLTAMDSSPSIDGAGCYMALQQGEKVVNAATSIGGQTFFGTNQPGGARPNVCSANLGIARTYGMPLFCVARAGDVVEGGGLPPSPVAGIVTVPKADGSGSMQVPFVIGAPNVRKSAIEGSRLQPEIVAPRQRRYWFREVQR